MLVLGAAQAQALAKLCLEIIIDQISLTDMYKYSLGASATYE